MAKILLVEDDNNLREIYEARLQAEGYTIVSAQDGEAALVVAKKEKPDLIIADVMMPRISGFEMLDILRNTEGLKDVRIIMLTALSQAEDQSRATKLGADRYLVKSQVTLEDIVKNAADILAESGAIPSPAPAVAATPAIPLPEPVPASTAPVAVAPVPIPAPAPQPTATIPVAMPVAMPTPAVAVAAPPVTPVQATPSAVPTPVPAQPAPMPPQPTAPTPVQPQPAQPQPAPVPEPAPNSNEKIMANAVKDLLANNAPAVPPAPPTVAAPVQPPVAPAQPTPLPAQPPTPTITPKPTAPLTTPAPAEPPVIPAPVAATQPESVPADPAQSSSDSDNSNSDDTVRKKIIQPINPNVQPAQSDLSALLAKEGITDFDKDEQTDGGNRATPHPPGHVISPNPAGGQNQPNQPIDPNSISL
ncbi:MAG TPA: response regulator [Patescibacteria group bacterium]|nr:response regulator [Patescibacteria group bacterium]